MGNLSIYDADVLFIGGLFPAEKYGEIVKNSKVSVQNAANNLQWSIVHGLDAKLRNPVRLCNSMYVGSFPMKYRRAFLKTEAFSHTQNARDIDVGFLNLPVYKHISKTLHLRRHLRAWAKEENGLPKFAVAYAATEAMLQSLRYIKRVNPAVVCCLVVPDLPEFMNPNAPQSFAMRVKGLLLPHLYKQMRQCDCFVYLTEAMAERVAPGKPFTVVEGIAEENPYSRAGELPAEKRIVYTGTLDEVYGVMELVDAFRRLPDASLSLVLCGSGNAAEKIKACCAEDSRIHFAGLLPHDEVLKLQAEAWLLVNPRSGSGEYTRYSFPSKTMEYMSSGAPTLVHLLPGMPAEYKAHVYAIPETPDGLYEALQTLTRQDGQGLRDFAKEAQAFILREKCPAGQANKVLQLLFRTKGEGEA